MPKRFALILASGLVIAACGSSADNQTRSAVKGYSQALAFSKCMRAHGISGFPDPTTTPPSGPAGYSAVMGRDGVFLAIPNSIDAQSPGFKQAAAACNFGPRGGQVPKTRAGAVTG
jgi:hypothetical protein